jgi:hypothetical protein
MMYMIPERSPDLPKGRVSIEFAVWSNSRRYQRTKLSERCSYDPPGSARFECRQKSHAIHGRSQTTRQCGEIMRFLSK